MSDNVDFFHLQEICQTNTRKIWNTARKTGLDAAKSASKKVFHKAAEATGELLGNKIAEKNVRPKSYLMRIQEMLKKLLFHQRKDKKY